MNKKGADELYSHIGEIIIAVAVILLVLIPVGNKLYANFYQSEEKPTSSTVSSLDNLALSIRSNEKQQLLSLEGNYVLTFFNKGTLDGLGGLKRPAICSDTQSCICLCDIGSFGANLDDCSKDENKRKTICQEIEADEIVLEGIDSYLGSGIHQVFIDVTKSNNKQVVKLTKKDINQQNL